MSSRGNRLADDPVGGRGLRRHLGGGFALEVDLRGEFAVGHLAAVGRADHAVRDLQRVGRDAELLGGEIDQDRAHLGAGEPQRQPAVLDRLAAGGQALVGRLAGVAGDHREPRERQVELLRRDLRERGQDALAEFDLAGEHRRGAVGVDAEPGIEPAVALQAAGQAAAAGRLRSKVGGREREGEHDAASPLVKLRRERVGAFMVRSSPCRWAARSTAPMMRLWVPQRQRLPASACRTSASFARGLRSSNSLADMIMPLMQ